ncbi:MAG: transketolase C-terminal domain-containing protein [Pseudomonadota bacterium]
MHLSRALDAIEEERLLPQGKLFYQFSARGHDLAQLLLAQRLTHPADAVNGYYRSRPMMLGLGLEPEEALAGPLMKVGGFSDGRDIGVVFNLPRPDGPKMLPMCGGVGAQYTPVAGWAQALTYRERSLGEDCAEAIAVAMGGDASCATNGFWSALNIATAQSLPMLFFVEDNGYGISVPSTVQTPGGNIAANLSGYGNLHIIEGDGTMPESAASKTADAVAYVRRERRPAMLRLSVPRLSGHSAQDTQAYRGSAELEAEARRDPLVRLHDFLVPTQMSEHDWQVHAQVARATVENALDRVLARPTLDPQAVTRFVFSDPDETQQVGGLRGAGVPHLAGTLELKAEPGRVNMLAAIRRTLDAELSRNQRMVVFGEDVGAKGGVHGATLGLAQRHGAARVFDTSLSEEGIIGRAVGMAMAGLLPVPEIQFRKYADPAEEQLNDCGSMRWRTGNRFAAPIVVRMPGGFFRCGDPWHSQTGEVKWAHAVGWKLAFPSNAQDATGLLRSALRGDDPVIFFEHRALLDAASARADYPGDDYVLPFGQARVVRPGKDLSLITWGAMVARAEQAGRALSAAGAGEVEVIDLRTLVPWDRECVIRAVQRTGRCLIVHEDNLTAGFGAEIAATITDEAFFALDAPVRRLAMADIPSPHSPALLEAAVPSASDIENAARALLEF